MNAAWPAWGKLGLKHRGRCDHVPVQKYEQQEKTAGEENEDEAAQPILSGAGHIFWKCRCVRDLHRASKRLECKVYCNETAEHRDCDVGNPFLPRPWRFALLCESGIANGEKEKA